MAQFDIPPIFHNPYESMERSVDTSGTTSQFACLTRSEQDVLRSFESPGYDQEQSIASINRKLRRTLEMRYEAWTSSAPGIATDFPSNRPKIMLVGCGGVGKSRLGSVLVSSNDAVFKSNVGSKSADPTVELQRANFKYEGQHMAVFDTPGYVINDLMHKDLKKAKKAHKAIQEGLLEIGDGVHVIIFVISAANSRMCENEIRILEESKLLNPKTFEHCMLVVTHSASRYSEGGLKRFLDDMKKSDANTRGLDLIKDRIVLVEQGSGAALGAMTTDTYAYECELQQVREMVLSMVSEVMTGKRAKGISPVYTRKSMREDLEMAFPKGRCFPSMAVVNTTEGTEPIRDIEVNDDVLVVNQSGIPKYEPVIMFSHAAPDVGSGFVSITIECGKVLHVSPGHLLPIGGLGSLKSACEVKIGDPVLVIDGNKASGAVTGRVLSVGTKYLRGLYSQQTLGGTIVVDGMVGSCYTNNKVTQGALLPVRVLDRILPTGWSPRLHALSLTESIMSSLRSVASIWQ